MHLVGHSFGGTVALAAALANSIDVASLSLFEANPLALLNRQLLVLGRSSASPGSSHLGSVTRAALREARCPVAVVDVVAPSLADPSDARQTASAS